MADNQKPRVLVATRAYPPAFVRGGPARSVSGIVETLADEFDFRVVTSAYDDPDEPPMAVDTDAWVDRNGAQVHYLSRKRPTLRQWRRLLAAIEPEVLYANSLFHPDFTLRPLVARLAIRRRPLLLLAPRGELAETALAIRSGKKRAFLKLYRALRIHRHVRFHAASEREHADLQREFGDVDVVVARNLRRGLELAEVADDRRAVPLRAVFLGRVVPVKNLHVAIEALGGTETACALTVAGPLEDDEYVARCRAAAAHLPEGRTVTWHGPVAGDEVVEFLSSFDVFVFPSRGESFGHVILEALAAGLPVILGPDSPWDAIDANGAGVVCDMDDPSAIAIAIDSIGAMSSDDYASMRTAATLVAEAEQANDSTVDIYRSMLRAAAS